MRALLVLIVVVGVASVVVDKIGDYKASLALDGYVHHLRRLYRAEGPQGLAMCGNAVLEEKGHLYRCSFSDGRLVVAQFSTKDTTRSIRERSLQLD